MLRNNKRGVIHSSYQNRELSLSLSLSRKYDKISETNKSAIKEINEDSDTFHATFYKYKTLLKALGKEADMKKIFNQIIEEYSKRKYDFDMDSFKDFFEPSVILTDNYSYVGAVKPSSTKQKDSYIQTFQDLNYLRRVREQVEERQKSKLSKTEDDLDLHEIYFTKRELDNWLSKQEETEIELKKVQNAINKVGKPKTKSVKHSILEVQRSMEETQNTLGGSPKLTKRKKISINLRKSRYSKKKLCKIDKKLTKMLSNPKRNMNRRTSKLIRRVIQMKREESSQLYQKSKEKKLSREELEGFFGKYQGEHFEVKKFICNKQF